MEEYAEALAFFAHSVFIGDFHIFKEYVAVTCTAAAHHMRHVLYAETLCVSRYEECCVTVSVVSVGFIGNCNDVICIAYVSEGNECLASVDDPLVTLLFCLCSDISTGAAALFCQSKCCASSS